MKKLLVAAIGAAAAYGAFADPYINAVRLTESGEKDIAGLEAAATITTMQGTHFGAPLDSAGTNQYAIAAITGGLPTVRPLSGTGEAFQVDPTTELSVKTQFGKPLEFYVDPANTSNGKSIGNGLYFDSMVKFTVCDGDPEQDYTDAKIVMWLQTNEAETQTNLMVKAGYLSKVNGNVEVAPIVYTCNAVGGDFADKWHRVTIKAIADITANEGGVPAFAIYIDGGDSDNIKEVATAANRLDGSFDYTLTEAADFLNRNRMLFPSLKQGTDTGTKNLSCVAFDGTGWLNDLVVTDQLPGEFAKDHEANKAKVKIGDQGLEVPYESLEEMVSAVNTALAGGSSVSVTLLKGMTIATPLEFTGSGTLTLDFAGVVLTNENSYAAITNSAANLVITNSSETVGGIYCSDKINDVAFYAASGNATITAGFFNGLVGAATGNNLSIVQGYFTQVTDQLSMYLPEGKILVDAEEMPGFRKVDDKPIITHTITFNANGGTLTGDSSVVINDGEYVARPSKPTNGDYTFIGWFWDDDEDPSSEMAEFGFADSEEPTDVQGDITLFAQWEAPAVPEYTVTFRTNNVEFATQNVTSNSTATAPDPAPTAAAGYTFNGWYEGNSAVAYNFATPVTGDLTLDAKFDLVQYTITYKTAEGNDFTSWASEYTAPASFTVEVPATLPVAANVALLGGTFNGWTNAVGQTVTGTAGLTENLVVFANVTAGSTNWVTEPEQIADDTPASTVYSELTGTALESTDAKKLTVWAKANGKTVGAVAEAAVNSDLYDAYLLNCTEAQLETAKENFKIPSITFNAEGKPVIGAPTGSYNGNIQQKGSNDLSTWTVIDGSTYEADDFQFFKLELVP